MKNWFRQSGMGGFAYFCSPGAGILRDNIRHGETRNIFFAVLFGKGETSTKGGGLHEGKRKEPAHKMADSFSASGSRYPVPGSADGVHPSVPLSNTWLIQGLAECWALGQISQVILKPARSPAGFFFKGIIPSLPLTSTAKNP
jgi:hypothetical protein